MKRAFIHDQVVAQLVPTVGGNITDAGVVVTGYHNASAGAGALEVWYGSAPDMGAEEYDPSEIYIKYLFAKGE